MKIPTLTEYHQQTEAEVHRLDETFPSGAFNQRVRHTLYKFALIRNSWGTTNLDAGPIELARVVELYEAYEAGITPPGRVLPTEIEVLNYFRLVDGLPATRFEVGLETVRDVHRDYFRGVPLQDRAVPGRWKEADNVVAGPFGVLRTTPTARVEADLDALLEWLNGAAWELPPLARGALFFHEFQRIHPFGDGNGRVGRLLTLLVLRSGGLPAIVYCPIDDAINEDREEYYRALHAADQGNLEYWVGYFTATVADGYRRSHILGERLQGIPNSVPEESQRLLEWAYIHRIRTFKVADVRKFLGGLSKATITRRLRELENLALISGSGRGAGRVYAVASIHETRKRASVTGEV